MDSIFDVLRAKSNDFQVYDTSIKSRADGSLEIRLYDSPIMRKRSNLEPEVKQSSVIKAIETRQENKQNKDNQIIRSDSLARTRQLLIDYACQNFQDWKSFITLTFADDENGIVSDINYANKKFNIWCTSIKRVYPDFKYLGVPEFQKRGAVHYHILTNIICGSSIIPLREPKLVYSKKKKCYEVISYYDLKFWPRGWSTAFDVMTADDNFNCALYLMKYFYKDIDNRLWGNRKILKSSNLAKPVPILLMSDSEECQKAMDYAKKRYTVNSSTRIQPTEDNKYIKSLEIINLHENDNLQIDNCQSEIDDDMEF